MQPQDDREFDALPDRNRSDYRECLVLACKASADQVWTETTVTTDLHQVVTWPVCREHYLRLTAGEAWEAMSGGPRSFRRWLLMGTQLDTWPRPVSGWRSRLPEREPSQRSSVEPAPPAPDLKPRSA